MSLTVLVNSAAQIWYHPHLTGLKYQQILRFSRTPLIRTLVIRIN